MTVAELIQYLSGHPEEALVILAKDEEGNGFSPLDEAAEGHYTADTTYSGEVHDEARGGSVRAVVLWPVN